MHDLLRCHIARHLDGILKIAVVGAGAAGLSAARALGRRHQVELYERALRPGGHALTIEHRGAALDTGFLVFNPRRYPHFTRMLRELGVPTRETSMSFSVSAADGSVEWGSADLASAYARRRDLLRPAHHRFLLEVVRFLGRARRDLARGAAAELSLGDYAERRGVSRELAEHLLIPLAGSLWSVGRRASLELPAETFLRFLQVHGMLRPALPPRWRTITGGSRRYVDALVARAGFSLELGAEAVAIERDGGGVTLHLAGGEVRRADRAVLAVHADRALSLLDAPSEAERRLLGAFRFTDNELVLHTDASRLPRARAARASWNYRIEEGGAVSVSYWLNRLQGLEGGEDYLVTLNPRRPIDPARVIRRLRLRHPRFDLPALRAQRELWRLQGRRGIYYAGAWAGFGFHEDAVRSGLAAAARALV